MLVSQWSPIVLGVVATAHLLLAYRLYRLQIATDTHRSAAADDDRVVCPECRTANEPGYRYCRGCVSGFPGAIGVERPSTSALGGLTQ